MCYAHITCFKVSKITKSSILMFDSTYWTYQNILIIINIYVAVGLKAIDTEASRHRLIGINKLLLPLVKWVNINYYCSFLTYGNFPQVNLYILILYSDKQHHSFKMVIPCWRGNILQTDDNSLFIQNAHTWMFLKYEWCLVHE